MFRGRVQTLTRALAATMLLGGLVVAGGCTADPPSIPWEWRHEQRLLGRAFSVADVALLDDAARVVVAQGGKRIVVWNVQTALQDMSIPCADLLPRGTGPLRVVLASADARRIVCATRSHIAVLDGRTGAMEHALEGASLLPYTMDLSRDGRWLAARTGHRDVTVWDLDAEGEPSSIIKLAVLATSLALSDDGTWLAVGGPDRVAIIYEVGGAASVMSVFDHGRPVNRVALTPDKSRLATASEDGFVTVWDTLARAPVATLQTSEPLTSMALNARGNRLLAATGEGPARLWNVDTGAVVRVFRGGDMHATHVRLSPDERRAVAVGPTLGTPPNRHSYGVWMIGTGRPEPSVKLRPAGAMGVELSHDGARALVVSYDSSARLVDTVTGAELRSFDGPPAPPEGDEASRRRPDPRAKRPFRILRLLGDGSRVLDITRDGGIVVRDAETAASLGSFGAGPASDYPCILSPDHRMLLTGDVDGNAHLWDVETRSYLRTLPGDGSRVLSASFDAESRAVVTGSMDAAVVVWDARTGERRGTLRTSVPGPHAVSVSPDGGRVLVWRRGQYVSSMDAGVRATARLWELHSLRAEGRRRRKGVLGGVWRTDSRVLYTTGSADGYTGRVVKAWTPGDFSRSRTIGPERVWVRPAIYYPDRSPSITEVTSWPPQNETPVSTERLPFDRRHGVGAIAISADGTTFAAVGYSDSVDIWRRSDSRSSSEGEQ